MLQIYKDIGILFFIVILKLQLCEKKLQVLNPSVHDTHLQVTHTWKNLQLKAAALFKYV